MNSGFGTKSIRGIRTTKSTKRLGCSQLKNLIENQKLIIQDFETIAELSTFVAKGSSFEAEEGSHDDLVMCLVLFSWMTNQNFFMDIVKDEVRKKVNAEQLRQIEEESLPMILAGHIDVDENTGYVEDGAFWNIVEKH